MPIFEYICPGCKTKCERNVPYQQADNQYCDLCGLSLDLQVSRPAPFKVGKYGKGGQQ